MKRRISDIDFLELFVSLVSVDSTGGQMPQFDSYLSGRGRCYRYSPYSSLNHLRSFNFISLSLKVYFIRYEVNNGMIHWEMSCIISPGSLIITHFTAEHLCLRGDFFFFHFLRGGGNDILDRKQKTD